MLFSASLSRVFRVHHATRVARLRLSFALLNAIDVMDQLQKPVDSLPYVSPVLIWSPLYAQSNLS